MMDQQLDRSSEQTGDGYPDHPPRNTETSASAFRRLLYCAILTLLVIVVASSFELSLAIICYVLAAVGLSFGLWRFAASRHVVTP